MNPVLLMSLTLLGDPATLSREVYTFDGFQMVVQPGFTIAPEDLASMKQAKATSRMIVRPASYQVDADAPQNVVPPNVAPPLPDEPATTGSSPMPPAPIPATDNSAESPTAGPAGVGSVAAPAVDCQSTASDVASRVKHYRAVYDAIPFSRAEYDANPSYRHDATLEFLFGTMRPTVVQRGTTRVDVNLPAVDYVPAPYNTYGMNYGYYPFWSPGYRVYRGY